MTITKVYDANVYVNNASTHGQASEITAPAINAVMADYKAMGMVGSMELFNGFDKMETTIKWTYPNNEVQKACANFLKPVDLMIRSSKAEYDNGGISGEKPIVMYVRGYPKTHPSSSNRLPAALLRQKRIPSWKTRLPSITTNWKSTAMPLSRST